MGGMELIESIKSLKAESQLYVYLNTGQIDSEAKVVTWWMEPDKLKVHQVAASTSSTYGSNGITAWRTDSQSGGYKILDKFVVDNLRVYGSLHALALHIPEYFQIASTSGSETIAGTECYSLTLANPDSPNDADTVFFSISTGLLRALQMKHNSDGIDTLTVTYLFDDWKSHDELKLFSKVTVFQEGTRLEVNYVRISLNTVKPSDVALPKPVQEQIKSTPTAPATETTNTADS